MSHYSFDWKKKKKLLHKLFYALDDDCDDIVDWRDLICALRVYQYPAEDAITKFRKYFHVYATTDKQITLEHAIRIVLVWTNDSHEFLEYRKKGKHLFDEMLSKRSASSNNSHNQKIMLSLEPFLQSIRDNPSFVETAEERLWELTPSKDRLQMIERVTQKTLGRIDDMEKQWKLSKAVRFWYPRELSNKFRRWRIFTHKSLALKAAIMHYRRRKQTKGIRHLWDYTQKRMTAKRNWKKAVLHYNALLTKYAFKHCTAFLRVKQRQKAMAWERAKSLFNTLLLESIMRKWKSYTRTIVLMRRAVEDHSSKMITKCFETWKEHAQALKEERLVNERKAAMRQKEMEQGWKEADDERRRLEAEAEAERKRLEEERKQEEERIRADKERWEQQKKDAANRAVQRRIRQIQEIEWKRQKEEAQKEEWQDLQDKWSDLKERAKQIAETEAYDYLVTPEGREVLNIMKERVKEASALRRNKNKDVTGQNEEDKVWEKIFDPLLNEYFFYNHKTGERVMADQLSDVEAEALARSQFVEERIRKALKRTEYVEAQETQKWIELKAAKRIQAMARIKLARKKIRKIIDIVYVKRVDPYTGDQFYYNTVERTAAWEKPVNLGSKDLVVDEWVTMFNQTTNEPYYCQTIKPYETRKEKPKGYAVCLECNYNLAKRRCEDCKLLLCLDCFDLKHKEWTNHKWSKHGVRQMYCQMCKEALAQKCCAQCDLDCFCNKCDRMMHMKAARSRHIRVDI
eukprot:g3432.t1